VCLFVFGVVVIFSKRKKKKNDRSEPNIKSRIALLSK
jgi:cbb3-type cytochrome oxidase subunit 3